MWQKPNGLPHDPQINSHTNRALPNGKYCEKMRELKIYLSSRRIPESFYSRCSSITVMELRKLTTNLNKLQFEGDLDETVVLGAEISPILVSKEFP